MMGKISASMCVLALILFLFPWITVSCRGPEGIGTGAMEVGTQSGCQAMYGGFTLASGESKTSSADRDKSSDKYMPHASLLTTLAFLAVLGSAVIAVAAEILILPLKLQPGLKNVLESVRRLPVQVGLLTGIALALLLFSWIIGFPTVRKVRQFNADVAGQSDESMPVQVKAEAHYLFPLYLEMLVLIPPTFLMLNEKYKWVSLSGIAGTGAQAAGGAEPASGGTEPATDAQPAAGATPSGEGEAPAAAEPPPQEEPPS